MKKNHIIIALSWMAVLFWMLLIFKLSAQVAAQSAGLSNSFTQVIVKIVDQLAMGFDWIITDHLIRKCAHFSSYLILGLLVVNALTRSGISGIKTAVLICIIYAISDEVHQMFVPGRGPGVTDVLIDSAGALVGILGYRGLAKINKSEL